MIRLFRSELLKLRKSPIAPLVCVSPVIAAVIGLLSSQSGTVNPWTETLTYMATLHALLFLPLLAGVFSAFVCRYEHAGGGWKQLLALPVSRSSVFVVKFAIVLGLLAFTQLLLVAGLLAVGTLKGFAEPVPWGIVAKSALGGLLACMPLAALQLAVSVAWSSFAAPLAVNVVFTLPNILVANSETYGPYYPWAQPLLAMLPPSGESFGAFLVPAGTLFTVIFVCFAVFFITGLGYFRHKSI
ncbi:ABC transporter permease [Paenibacillus ginsengarvi]|uniref:ABC transporter permease n=1 Tax=Paenibacillus ginsengarvi TaxID=400777 RepID=A0A3B0CFX7_9BACL|nr:ABC transporter permease [Paenibacillus ginsengarvi]RKN84302.1 hypothetical protein D7M11_15000 [Paenibacillus ginsengarvi]